MASLFSSFRRAISAVLVGNKQPQAWLTDLRAALFEADLPESITSKIIAEVSSAPNFAEALPKVRKILEDFLPEDAHLIFTSPSLCLLVGVNGAGKTTTAARLAHYLSGQGHKVVLGAADTFRAGAAEQLIEWGKRLAVPVVAAGFQSDPASVAHDTVHKACELGGVAIIDTAGRVHTKVPLMEELKKVERVALKALKPADAPKKTFLVLDGNIGQNSLSQAAEFSKAIPLDGIILTKLDGHAKAGFIFKVWLEFKLPVVFLGVGEGVEDLIPFSKDYLLGQLLLAQ